MSEENVDVVRRVYDAALRGDIEAVISHLDPAVRADMYRDHGRALEAVG